MFQQPPRFSLFVVCAAVVILAATISAMTAQPTYGGSAYSMSLPVVSRSCTVPLILDVAPNVPEKDIEEITGGMCMVQTSLENYYGGDMPIALQEAATLKIVAKGESPCCTAFAESGFRPYFDVLSPDWVNPPPAPFTLSSHHEVVGAHEYVHGWQWALGCISMFHQPLGDWLNEGIAHYVGHDPLIRWGYMTAADVRTFQVNSSIYTGEADVPLASLEGPGNAAQLWPGHIGYLAVEKLVADSPKGPLSLRTICEAIASGATVDDAFQSAFGISKSDFYEDFPAYFDTLRP